MRNPLSMIRKAVALRGLKRSSRWPRVRQLWLEIYPQCAACGGLDNVEVHHVIPFHLHPELELDDTNFISLCEKMGTEHHLRIGHTVGGHSSWKINNPDVRKDCARLNPDVH